MTEKQRLFELIYESLERTSGTCDVCSKMGYKCPVEIPDNPDLYFNPDFSKCNFKAKVCKTLTIEP